MDALLILRKEKVCLVSKLDEGTAAEYDAFLNGLSQDAVTEDPYSEIIACQSAIAAGGIPVVLGNLPDLLRESDD